MGKSYLKELRTDLTNFIIATVTYSAIVIIPAFYWRLFQERDATYHFAMVVPLFCGAVLLVLHIGRDRFNPTLRALTLSTLFVFMGISGLLARGILGPAFFFMMLAIICLSLILPLKKMLIAACLIVGVFIALVAGYLSGVIIINVNPEQVFASNAAWIAYLMVPVYCCFLVIFSFNRYNRMVETLMSELDEERAEVIKLANRDPLTNLYNLRAASYRAKMTLSMAKRQHKKVPGHGQGAGHCLPGDLHPPDP